MRCSNPRRGQAAAHHHAIDGRIVTRVLVRRGAVLAVREYEAGALRSEETIQLADAHAAERALRARQAEWEAEGWAPGGRADYFQAEPGEEPSTPSILGESEITARELAEYRAEHAAQAKQRARRNARYERLHAAIDEGRAEDALELIAKGCPRTPADCFYEPALELAAQRGYVPVVAALARRRESLELAVVTAAAAGRLELLRFLIEERGGDPSSAEIDRTTALMAAAENGERDVVAYLLERGADANATANGRTAAELAAEEGHEAVARLVAERSDRSPEALAKRLFQAVSGNRPDEVRRLAAAGAPLDGLNTRGETLLHVAIQRGVGDPPTVEALLEAGADPSQRTSDGWSPWLLCRAMQRDPVMAASQRQIARLLERAGASKQGEAALELHSAARQGDFGRVEEILAAGVGPDDAPLALSPLGAAASQGHEDVVRLLLEHGAVVDRREPDYFTPLIDAAYAGHLGVVKRLVAAGASLAAEVKGMGNAADYAVRGGHHEVAAWLEADASASQRLVRAVFERERGARLGWRLFERHAEQIGNGEHSLLLVEAPIGEVAPALAGCIDDARHHAAIEREAATIHRRARPIFAVQLRGQRWTLVVHAMGSLGWGTFDKGRELAATLAERRTWRVVHAHADDDSERSGFDLFEGGRVTRGNGRLLRELEIALPGFDPYASEGIRIFGVTREDVERVDVIEA